MLRRRILEHLRTQQWSALAIDFAIVVFGVFFGNQVSNWNEDRQTSAKAARFAESLTADLRAEAWIYEYLIHYYGNVLANADRVVNALTGREPLSDEALLIGAFRATQYSEHVRRRATYDELTSTGSIGLIRDPLLRQTAILVFTTNNLNNIIQEARTSQYRKTYRMTVPNEVQRVLEKACGDRVAVVGDYNTNFADAINYPCSTGLPPNTVTASVALLRANADFLPSLRLRVADLETAVANLSVYEGEVRVPLRGFIDEPR